MKGPLNTCLKDRYTLIEQSDLNTLIEQSQYSSEEQYSKLIDKEIWLVMGSYCHCQQVVTFFFFFFFGLHLTTWVKGPTLTLCPGPLNFSGRPWLVAKYVLICSAKSWSCKILAFHPIFADAKIDNRFSHFTLDCVPLSSSFLHR